MQWATVNSVLRKITGEMQDIVIAFPSLAVALTSVRFYVLALLVTMCRLGLYIRGISDDNSVIIFLISHY